MDRERVVSPRRQPPAAKRDAKIRVRISSACEGKGRHEGRSTTVASVCNKGLAGLPRGHHASLRQTPIHQRTLARRSLPATPPQSAIQMRLVYPRS